jgi:hypothetical protein
VLRRERSLALQITIAMPLCSCSVALIFEPPLADIYLAKPGEGHNANDFENFRFSLNHTEVLGPKVNFH